MTKQLDNGRCLACDTQVEHEIDGVRMHFIPHDNPEWCRAAAASLVKWMRAELRHTAESHTLARQREAFYAHAFATALRELAANCGTHPDTWRERIEKRVRTEMAEAKERAAIAMMLAESRGEP